MALQATFVANFESFDRGIKAATENVKAFELPIKGIQKQLQSMTSSFDGSKIVREASLSVAAIEKVGGVTKLTEGELKKVQGTLDEAVAKFRALGQEVPKDIQAVSDQIKALNAQGKLDGPTQGLTQLGSSAGPAALAVTGVTAAAGVALVAVTALGAGAVAAFNQVVSLTKGAADLGDQLFTTANKTGLSTEAISKLQFVAEQTDAPFETIISSIQKLGENLATGSDKTTAALSRIGVSIDDIRKSSPDQAFETIITALGKVPDAGQRAAAGAAIFGKQFRDISQLTKEDMKALGEEAESLGIVFSDEFAVAGDKFNEELNKVRKQIDGVKAAIGAEFLPAATAFVKVFREEFTKAFDEAGVSGEGFGHVVDTVANAVVQSLVKIIEVGAETAAGLAEFFTGDTIKSSTLLNELKSIAEIVLFIARGMSAIGTIPSFVVDGLERSVVQLRELGSAELETGVTNTATRIRDFANAAREAAERVGDKFPEAIKKARAEIAAQAQAMRDARGDTDSFGKQFKDTGEEAAKAAKKLRDSLDDVLSKQKDLTDLLPKSSAAGHDFAASVLAQAEAMLTWNRLVDQVGGGLDRLKSKFEGFGQRAPQIPTVEASLGIPAAAIKAMQDKFEKAGTDAGRSFGEGLQGFLEKDLGNLIIGAFQGGGDVGKTIGAGFGKFLGDELKTSLGATLKNALGDTLGGALGSALGPLGALAGGALGGLFDKLFGPSEHSQVNDMRDEFQAMFGDLHNLNKAAHDVGLTLDKFLKADNIKDYEAAVKELEEAFQMQEARAALADQAGGFDKLSAKAARLGIDLQAIANPSSFAAFTEAVNALNAAFEAQQSRVEGLSLAGQGLQASTSGLLAQITTQLETGAGATAAFVEGIQDKFANLGTSATTTFLGIVQETGSWRKAMEAVGPSLDDLIKIQEKLGLQGSETLHKLLEFRRLSQVHADIATQIEGAAQQLTGLGRAGRLTQDAIDRFSRDAVQNFDTLIDRGVSVDQALMLMQPTLQALWEAQETLGLKTDDATASLIELARQNGLVGPGFVQEGDKMVAAIEKLVGSIEDLIGFMRDDVPASAQTAADAIQDRFENLDIQVPVGFDVEPFPDIAVPTVNVPTSVEGFERGTNGIRNFGSGTLVALHGKEEVLTERQSRALRSGRSSVVVNIDARGALLGDYSSQQQLSQLVQKALAQELNSRRRMPLPGVAA